MKARTVWRGQHGAVILGPTEDRVARYLADVTKYGRVTIRTVDMAARLRLERSEAYRILRRLQALGVFGIEDDRSGQRGGRRIWRTDTPRGRSGLDHARHRQAWARVLAALVSRRRTLAALIRRGHAPAPTDTAGTHRSAVSRLRPVGPRARPDSAIPPPPVSPTGGGGSFADRMRAAGLAGLMDQWGVS